MTVRTRSEPPGFDPRSQVPVLELPEGLLSRTPVGRFLGRGEAAYDTLWRYVRERRLDYLVDWPGDVAEMLGPDSAARDYVKLADAGEFELWGRRFGHLAAAGAGR